MSDYDFITVYPVDHSVIGGKMKEKGINHWADPNVGATNETGFTALPGGSRAYWGGFEKVGYNGFWWGSDHYSSSMADCRHLNNITTPNYLGYFDKQSGFSVRCLRDN
jgi:uncharacterized protein (TIGR02145 family)